MFTRFSHKSSAKPLARTEGLSVTISGDETLVYDREQFVIHRLSAVTAAIWKLTDGTRDIATLAAEMNLSGKSIEESLGVLVSTGLVEAESVGTHTLTRRYFIGGGAGALAASTFIAPVAASCNESPVTPLGYCWHGDIGDGQSYSLCGKLYCCNSTYGCATW